MDKSILGSSEAAERLGIKRSTLYAWIAKSNTGSLLIRGDRVTIEYLQGGPGGQGRIMITEREVDRLLALMRVTPTPIQSPRVQRTRREFTHISVTPGRPRD